ncbi:UNVERIFIED_CONTAM: hypothetical protein H355_001620 [Colinus virginianus]|nr:hypothetical protein H355_001620 [Colinus virginianus]
MYVSYLLDKDGPMYPGPVRHSGGLNLAAQNFVGAAQYADYGGYHVNLDGAQSPGPAWPAPYAAPLRDDWGAYGQGAPPPSAAAVHGLNGGSPAAAMAYSPADFHHHHHHHHPHAHHHAGPAPHCSAGGMQPLGAAPPNAAAASAAPEPLSPGGQRRGLCEWVRKPAQAPLGSQGKLLGGVGEEWDGDGGGAKPTRSAVSPRCKGNQNATRSADQSCPQQNELGWQSHHSRSFLSPGAEGRYCLLLRFGERRNPGPTLPFLFCFLNAALSSAVKTRTKDKYRVVYTDHQRLELEKEFHYSRYITIRRKAELASSLGLSERQVKIWFQNRRAKERKINKKKLQQAQPGAAEPLSPSAPPLPGPAAAQPPTGLGPSAPQ